RVPRGWGVAANSSATCARTQRLAGSWWKRACQCCLTVNDGTGNGQASTRSFALRASSSPIWRSSVATRSDADTIAASPRKPGSDSITRRSTRARASAASRSAAPGAGAGARHHVLGLAVGAQRQRRADARVGRAGQADPVLLEQRLLVEAGVQ